MTRRLAIFLLLVLASYTRVSAGEQPAVTISGADELTMLGRSVWYFEDTTDRAGIHDIDAIYRQGKFLRHHKEVFTGPASTRSVWFRVTVRNRTGEDLWLDAGSSYSAWYIDFYRPDSAGRFSEPVQTGAMRPDTSKEYPVNNYWFRLAEKNDTAVKVFYVRILSGRTPEYPFMAGTLRALHDYKKNSDYLTAGFVGLMVVMILYNFFLFIATRDVLYCIYLGYLVTALFSFTYFYGYPLFPHCTWFWEYNFVWYAPGFLMVSWFSIRYLGLKQYPWLYRLILAETAGLVVVLPLLNGLGIPVKTLIPFNQPLLLLYSFTFVFTGVYLYLFRKQRIARYYFAGWSAESIAMIICIMVLWGVLPFNLFTRSILYTGIAIEMVMFSFALADRVNLLRRENLVLITRQNELLEQKVADRTRELEEQSESLREVNHTKDKLFAIIGHDLRGPVGGLRSILDMFTSGVLPKETFLELAPKLRDSVRSVHATLENLLQWSQSQMNGLRAAPGQTDVLPAVNEVLRLFADALSQKMIRLNNYLDEALYVYCDPDHLKLIFRNLLSNAVKFTPSGGAITLSAKAGDDTIIITVADTGIGLNAVQQQQLFQLSAGMSTQGTDGEKGTGLGLLLCRELAEKNKGKLWLQSAPDEGTKVFLELPRHA